MRTATILARGQINWWPENLFRGCCPCICLTLKLLSRLWHVVRDCVFIFFNPPSPLSLKRVWKSREGAVVYTCMRFCQSRLILVVVRVRVCVYLTDMRVERGKQGRRERDGEMLCANPYSRWRIQGHSFMFCQPSVNQFPIKVVLNSAVIPISLFRFCFTTTTAPPSLFQRC